MNTPLHTLLAVALASLALPTVAAEALTAGQMDAAALVYVGTADCDANERVTISAVADQPGHFKLVHKKSSYDMVPQETSTGAVRLENAKAGVVWLQIPAKSMLMNAKLGQRVADSCKMPEQRASN